METFKQIPGYEGLYEVSDLGNVRSLSRSWKNSTGGMVTTKLKILKPLISNGYISYALCKNNVVKRIGAQRIVYNAFYGIKDKMVIDHIDGNPLNNNLDNLRMCTSRQNVSFENVKRKRKKYSQYIGVTFNNKKWIAYITIKNKCINLGSYNNEFDAHLAYQSKLATLCL